MNEAIKLAIKNGGYEEIELVEWCGYGRREDWKKCIQCVIRNKEPLLDPAFWRSLGKALGWPELVIKHIAVPMSKEELLRLINKVKPLSGYDKTIENILRMDDESSWLYHWHRFIDWIAEGKDVDKFFEELLRNP